MCLPPPFFKKPSTLAFTTHRTVRFDEVDFAQVVYFPNYLGFCHEAFEDFFGAEGGLPYVQLLTELKLGFPIVHVEADYRAPLRFGDPCQVVMETVKLTARSISHRYRIYRGEDLLCAEITLVMACIGMDSFQAQEIPERLRALFLRHAA